MENQGKSLFKTRINELLQQEMVPDFDFLNDAVGMYTYQTMRGTIMSRKLSIIRVNEKKATSASQMNGNTRMFQEFCLLTN